jgi:histone acetyltransferase (RNA polymerase elongator complex component)
MIIPFFIPHSGCPHQCVFCNQKNITGQRTPVDPSSIAHRITAYLDNSEKLEPAQVAFYGGSFTALAIEDQKSYLEACRQFIVSGRIKGIRLSTRPDCISREALAFLRDHRVETIELGVQSMDDSVLRHSGRGHTAADSIHAVTLLREEGFTIGLQLMPGLPGDAAGTFMETVNSVIGMRPAFVRIYPALVIKETRLEALYCSGHYSPLSLDEAVQWCKNAFLRFERAGIAVIRMGLQPTEELQKPGTILAGPYHPAFRQLVDSSVLLDRMRTALSLRPTAAGPAYLYSHPSDVAAAIGQKRSNILALQKEFCLSELHIVAAPTVRKGSITYQ